MTIAGGPKHAVKVNGVAGHHVVRRQVRPAAEPRHRPAPNVADIGVHGGNARAPRMKDERDAGGAKLLSFPGKRPRHFGPQVAMHVGESNAGLLEHRAPFEHARPPASTRGTGPGVLAEPAPLAGEVRLLYRLDPRRQAVLQAEEELRGAIGKRGLCNWGRHGQACCACAGFKVAIRRSTSLKRGSRLPRFSKK